MRADGHVKLRVKGIIEGPGQVRVRAKGNIEGTWHSGQLSGH